MLGDFVMLSQTASSAIEEIPASYFPHLRHIWRLGCFLYLYLFYRSSTPASADTTVTLH